ncbi:unnamed protein product [Echinostoma caproni]|uniref:Uncharacterized protein n=1 Tax=Echinostoma caproni TaxID=27848 RepID=A0A183ABS4_9TREM|nr:unnamed protein product [Echinostoma caproni]
MVVDYFQRPKINKTTEGSLLDLKEELSISTFNTRRVAKNCDAPSSGVIASGAIARIRLKVSRPAAFEDGDVRIFPEFEDVAELSGSRTDRGKLTALRELLKCRARAVLHAARRGPEKME